MKDKKIIIAGGSGLLGKSLQKRFRNAGWEVHLLSTSKSDPANGIHPWAPGQEKLSPVFLAKFNVVINLSGAGVADKRWSPERKNILLNSRLNSTSTLVQALNAIETAPAPVLLSASAIGYYPSNTEVELNETKAAGNGFLSEVCKQWETTAHQYRHKDRLAVIRIGNVLSADGGYLKRLSPFSRLGILSPVGTGKQFFSWVHITDVTEIFYQLAAGDIPLGTYNAVSPQYVTNAEFTRLFNQSNGTPTLFPNIPAWVIKLLFGQLGREAVLSNQKVIPEALLKVGFTYVFSDIQSALNSFK